MKREFAICAHRHASHSARPLRMSRLHRNAERVTPQTTVRRRICAFSKISIGSVAQRETDSMRHSISAEFAHTVSTHDAIGGPLHS